MSYKWSRQYREASPEQRREIDEEYGDYMRDQAKDRRAEEFFEQKQKEKVKTNDSSI